MATGCTQQSSSSAGQQSANKEGETFDPAKCHVTVGVVGQAYDNKTVDDAIAQARNDFRANTEEGVNLCIGGPYKLANATNIDFRLNIIGVQQPGIGDPWLLLPYSSLPGAQIAKALFLLRAYYSVQQIYEAATQSDLSPLRALTGSPPKLELQAAAPLTVSGDGALTVSNMTVSGGSLEVNAAPLIVHDSVFQQMRIGLKDTDSNAEAHPTLTSVGTTFVDSKLHAADAELLVADSVWGATVVDSEDNPTFVTLENVKSADFSNTIFTNRYLPSSQWRALALLNSTATVTRSTFMNCAGAIYASEGSSLTVTKSIFDSNTQAAIQLTSSEQISGGRNWFYNNTRNNGDAHPPCTFWIANNSCFMEGEIFAGQGPQNTDPILGDNYQVQAAVEGSYGASMTVDSSLQQALYGKWNSWGIVVGSGILATVVIGTIAVSHGTPCVQ